MSSLQDRLVLGALLLEEASWLFALAGVLGLMLGASGSPMAWVAVLALSSASLLVVRFLQYLLLPSLLSYIAQMLVGVVVVYLVIGTQVGPSFNGVDMGWLGAVLFGEQSSEYMFRAVIGSFVGAFLWWRGGHLASMDFPKDSLTGSFKVGISALALATVVDIAHPAELNIYPVMFVFFAASIAGMSIAHLTPASMQATGERAWTRVIGLIVGAVVVMGLLFSLLQGNVLSVIATPLLWILNGIAMVVFFVIILPLAWLFDLVARWVYGFVQSYVQPQQDPNAAPVPFAIGDQLEALREGTTEEPVAEFFLQIIQWSIVAAIVIALLILLARAYRRRTDSGRKSEAGARDSIGEEADAAYDFANLLLGLLPARLRRKKKAPQYRVPDGDPNIVDVFRIYFGMLVMAYERGKPRQIDATPIEHQSVMESVISRGLVRRATAAFVRACYGQIPSSRQDIDEMRAELDRESKEKK